MSRPIMEMAGVALILITLPGTIELALLTLAAIMPSRHEAARREAKRISRLAVVIPAHNEAATIARSVSSVMECEPPPEPASASIVVVADNCTDDTAELASRYGARVIERVDRRRRGKGFALGDAFAMLLSEGFDAIMVVDADSVVESNLLRETVRLLNLGADGVQARYLALNPGGSASARLRNVALMAFNVLRPLGRARLGLSCGIAGNGFALSRETLAAVPYRAGSIVEDLEYHLRLVWAGKKIVFANDTTVRAEMPVRGPAARTQRARWEGGRLLMIAGNAPALARAAMLGNPRLLEPLLELLLFPLAVYVLILAATAAVPFTPARLYAAGAIGLAAFHMGAGIIVAGGDRSDLAACLAIPGYIVWKIALLPKTLASARWNAEWIRTER